MNPLAVLAGVSTLVDTARSVEEMLSKSRTNSAAQAASSTFASQLDDAISQYINAKDKDGDRKLTLSEFGGDTRQFAALDANHDGKLSTQELKGMFTS